MSGKCFVDTNILIYAQDRTLGMKHQVAKKLIASLWLEKRGVLSTQVLQEFCVNVQRKAAKPLDFAELSAILEDYLLWEIVVNSQNTIMEALRLKQRYQLSFWDALILRAAEVAEVGVVYSEDLSHGQLYGTLRVINPFIQ
jgi:predicted nucleic acid-binding protein